MIVALKDASAPLETPSFAFVELPQLPQKGESIFLLTKEGAIDRAFEIVGAAWAGTPEEKMGESKFHMGMGFCKVKQVEKAIM